MIVGSRGAMRRVLQFLSFFKLYLSKTLERFVNHRWGGYLSGGPMDALKNTSPPTIRTVKETSCRGSVKIQPTGEQIRSVIEKSRLVDQKRGFPEIIRPARRRPIPQPLPTHPDCRADL